MPSREKATKQSYPKPSRIARLDAPVKHLMVDLDGTLLGNRSLRLSVDFVQRAVAVLKKYGGVRQAMSVLYDIQAIFRRPHAEFTNDQRVIEVFAKRMYVSLEESRKILREGLFVIFPNLKKHFYPVAGAKEFLEWAKEHYPLTLTTNPVWPEDIVRMRVQWAGIDPSIFNSITHVRTMHASKPSPEYYKEVLNQQGLKPEEALLIGDDLKMDLPATRVGIRVFIVGPYTKIAPLKLKGQKALAWRGSHALLRKFLEAGTGKEK